MQSSNRRPQGRVLSFAEAQRYNKEHPRPLPEHLRQMKPFPAPTPSTDVHSTSEDENTERSSMARMAPSLDARPLRSRRLAMQTVQVEEIDDAPEEDFQRKNKLAKENHRGIFDYIDYSSLHFYVKAETTVPQKIDIALVLDKTDFYMIVYAAHVSGMVMVRQEKEQTEEFQALQPGDWLSLEVWEADHQTHKLSSNEDHDKIPRFPKIGAKLRKRRHPCAPVNLCLETRTLEIDLSFDRYPVDVGVSVNRMAGDNRSDWKCSNHPMGAIYIDGRVNMKVFHGTKICIRSLRFVLKGNFPHWIATDEAVNALLADAKPLEMEQLRKEQEEKERRRKEREQQEIARKKAEARRAAEEEKWRLKEEEERRRKAEEERMRVEEQRRLQEEEKKMKERSERLEKIRKAEEERSRQEAAKKERDRLKRERMLELERLEEKRRQQETREEETWTEPIARSDRFTPFDYGGRTIPRRPFSQATDVEELSDFEDEEHLTPVPPPAPESEDERYVDAQEYEDDGWGDRPQEESPSNEDDDFGWNQEEEEQPPQEAKKEEAKTPNAPYNEEEDYGWGDEGEDIEVPPSGNFYSQQAHVPPPRPPPQPRQPSLQSARKLTPFQDSHRVPVPKVPLNALIPLPGPFMPVPFYASPGFYVIPPPGFPPHFAHPSTFQAPPAFERPGQQCASITEIPPAAQKHVLKISDPREETLRVVERDRFSITFKVPAKKCQLSFLETHSVSFCGTPPEGGLIDLVDAVPVDNLLMYEPETVLVDLTHTINPEIKKHQSEYHVPADLLGLEVTPGPSKASSMADLGTPRELKLEEESSPMPESPLPVHMSPTVLVPEKTPVASMGRVVYQDEELVNALAQEANIIPKPKDQPPMGLYRLSDSAHPSQNKYDSSLFAGFSIKEIPPIKSEAAEILENEKRKRLDQLDPLAKPTRSMKDEDEEFYECSEGFAGDDEATSDPTEEEGDDPEEKNNSRNSAHPPSHEEPNVSELNEPIIENGDLAIFESGLLRLLADERFEVSAEAAGTMNMAYEALLRIKEQRSR